MASPKINNRYFIISFLLFLFTIILDKAFYEFFPDYHNAWYLDIIFYLFVIAKILLPISGIVYYTAGSLKLSFDNGYNKFFGLFNLAFPVIGILFICLPKKNKWQKNNIISIAWSVLPAYFLILSYWQIYQSFTQ